MGATKSRWLKDEWEKGSIYENPKTAISISDLQAGWCETSSLSYETSKPYGLFQRLLKRVLGARANNINEEKRAMIAELVNDFPPEEISNARKAFESLFNLDGENGNASLQGEQFKQALFRGFRMLWAQRAQAYPIVLVLDDLHWADPASVELLEHLFLLTNSVPIMFICSTRLERKAPSWYLRQVAEESYAHRLTQIKVRPLTEEDSIQLVENLMSLSDIPERLCDRILEKTEGNPFFVEEIVRTLLDIGFDGRSKADPIRMAKIESGEIDIPDNIQSLLIAKIDRLKEDERHTLQLAALIGRSFYFRILEMISEENPDDILPHHLDVFQQMDLIREVARYPELEYSFRHGLTQEAAYSTILLKQRRSFHRQVAEAIETLFVDQSEEVVATLAHHFDNAQVYDKAFHYSVEAGNQAYRLYAMKEAIEHYSRAVSYLDKIEVNSLQLIHVYNRRGRSLELYSDFKTALINYKNMEKLAQTNDDRPLELASIVAQATIYSNVNDQGNFERGLSLSKQALTLARELEDEQTEVKIQWNLLNALRFSEKVDEAVAAGERALELARKLKLPYENALAANDLSLPLVASGRSNRAREVLEEARELWREQNNQPMLANSLATASLVHTFAGDFDQSLDFSDEAYKISESIQNSWGLSYSQFGIGNVYWQRGNPGQAIQTLESVMKYGEEAKFSVAGVWSRSFLSRIYLRLGHINHSVELAEAAVSYAEKNATPWKALAAGVLAQARLEEGKFEQAEVLIQEGRDFDLSVLGSFLSIFQVEEPAIRLALIEKDTSLALRLAEDMIEKISAYNYLMYRPDALLLKAQVEIFAKQNDQAVTTLAEAEKEAVVLKANWVLWQVYHTRAQVLRDEDRRDEAKVQEAQARMIIDDITRNTKKESLKESFLARAQVRAVIQSSEISNA
jgi:predicted ATPase